ncbi:hypothetical protein YPPY72_0119, partial [Yersinia pestis PY-72]
MLNPL